MNYQLGDIVVGLPSADDHYAITTAGTKWIVAHTNESRQIIGIFEYSKENADQFVEMIAQYLIRGVSLEEAVKRVMDHFFIYDVRSAHFEVIGNVFNQDPCNTNQFFAHCLFSDEVIGI